MTPMTPMTRREVFLVTAAGAAVAPVLASAQAADGNKKPDLLVAAADPISDGSAIPIGVKISRDVLDQNKEKIDVDKMTSVAVTLNDGKIDIATFTFTNDTLTVLRKKGALEFSTRVQVPFAKNETNKALNLNPKVTIGFPGGTSAISFDGAGLTRTVSKADCPPATVGLLRLSTQPLAFKVGDPVIVKGMVPPPIPPGSPGPTKITSTFLVAGVANPLMVVDVKDSSQFADEFFVQFTTTPSNDGKIKITWDYKGLPSTEASINLSHVT